MHPILVYCRLFLLLQEIIILKSDWNFLKFDYVSTQICNQPTEMICGCMWLSISVIRIPTKCCEVVWTYFVTTPCSFDNKKKCWLQKSSIPRAIFIWPTRIVRYILDFIGGIRIPRTRRYWRDEQMILNLECRVGRVMDFWESYSQKGKEMIKHQLIRSINCLRF